MVGGDDKNIENAVVDESYWSRKLLEFSAKVGPLSLLVLVILLGLFVVPWPSGGNEGQTRSSLLARYVQSRRVDRVRSDLERGQVDAAVAGWKTLLAETPDDPRLLRLLLDQANQHRGSIIYEFGGMEGFGRRLLQVGQTNREDLLRLIRMEAGLGNWGGVRRWSEAMGSNKPPEVRRWLARVCLEEGDVLAFEETWSVKDAGFSEDPESESWRMAADAIAKGGDVAKAALDKLNGLKASADKGFLARRLLRLVARATDDKAMERQVVEELSAAGSERLGDWIDHLEMLGNRGPRGEVEELAPRIEEARCSAEDVPDAVMRLTEIGLNASAKVVLDRAVKSYPTDISVAMLKPVPFMVTGEWNGCLETAFALRGQQPTAGVTDAASFFVEGCAYEALGNDQKANAAFFEMESTTIPRPEAILQFAVLMGRLSIRPTNAVSSQRVWRLVKTLERPMAGSAAYWRARSEAAARIGQNVDMVLSAEKAVSLDQGSDESTATLIRALILGGGRHVEAVALSSRLMQSIPVEARWRLQHAVLLASGGHPDDGRKILARIKPALIPRQLRDDLRHAWLEVHVGAGEWEQARTVVRQIASERMDPFMAKRFNALAGAIPN